MINDTRVQLGGGFNFFYFHPYLGKISILTNIFQMSWNHQPVQQQKTKLQNPIIHHFATDPLGRNRGLCWELYFIFFQPWPPSLGCDSRRVFLVIFKLSTVHVHVEKPGETPEKKSKHIFGGNYIPCEIWLIGTFVELIFWWGVLQLVVMDG